MVTGLIDTRVSESTLINYLLFFGYQETITVTISYRLTRLSASTAPYP